MTLTLPNRRSSNGNWSCCKRTRTINSLGKMRINYVACKQLTKFNDICMFSFRKGLGRSDDGGDDSIQHGWHARRVLLVMFNSYKYSGPKGSFCAKIASTMGNKKYLGVRIIPLLLSYPSKLERRQQSSFLQLFQSYGTQVEVFFIKLTGK